MKEKINELLTRISALEAQLQEEYRKAGDDFARKRLAMAGEFMRQQRRYKIGLFRFLLRSRVPVLLTAPVIYLGWGPFLLMDLFVTIYQRLCFPIYRIPRVRRADYMAFDRADLPYLNLIEKFNCLYCSYGNGVAAYTREVAARTEQYWCPIKHARHIKAAHERYSIFIDHGDGEAYRQGLARLRHKFDEDKPRRTPLKAEDLNPGSLAPL
ncbi:MAG: hypothetical protein A2X30_09170 [Elusimicrobia bacterium GWB2_63_16]|nr:MAG: hypothetical protein A2X30_09170 [Elusimicrobia bacterium GWB2_63_16]